MDILQIVGLGLAVTFLALILKEKNQVFALLVSLVAGIFILLMMVDQIRLVMDMLKNMAQNAHLNNMYVATILKIIGIAYISEFGAQIAKDAGQGSMAGKIELAGKLIILVMAIPILTAIVDTIMNLMPQIGGG
ncbi:stage III sporulation protein AD [Sporolactobacillus laevolacticus]|jgi:stage III sporulation protein AD|uniref:Stage III sporulation protein AD n=1 Tax=Sporolactobacillus laevolacticus DSM 442 TaxID=1395513 RepID=V6J2R7_9BACL|nr:stage III sporulation protein AD [Sporolactobacillus laevolacticus]EST11059.1 stage III sporulation protein AD [Sporolactobacillus laevolacticus DSM 442]MDF2909806.1 spoIIIAD [Sporolactobacillus laevolacticus]MDN3956240.1 stage III sporulation protein AD [Sporolactobacillus laevolacticus]